MAHEQREQDLNISALQRETDKLIAEERRITDNLNAERQRNMSLDQRQHELIVEQQRYEKQQEQRLEDAKLAAEQRAQDLKLAEEKRIADNQNAKAQRDNDLLIAERKQLADDVNAEKERNVSREIEEYRYQQANNKELDDLLLAHINDMGVLLENHNGSLTKNPTIAALARAKTLHVIRSVGVERSTRLLQFLFDAGQLTHSHDQESLDLSGAVLNRIDMSVTNDIVSMRNVSFVGVHMNEATFIGQDLSHWNFTDASLAYANFSDAFLDGTVFRRANLTGASFAQSNGKRCVFNTARLPKSTFYKATMGFANFYHADLTRANLEGSYLSGSTLAFASLIDAQMNDVYLLFANLSYANMLGAVCLEEKCQIHDALSLYHAILPNGTNGTVGHRPLSLLRNGRPVCAGGGSKDDHLVGWQILEGSVYTASNYDNQTCVFTHKGGTTASWASMSQKGDISMYKRLITNGHAMVSLKTHRGRYTRIKMNEIDEAGKVTSVLPSQELLSAPEMTVWEKNLRPTTVQIEVILMFQVSQVWELSWFEYIELTILLWLP
ncbi:unnamed protein product [Adineta steineri]|uniref:Uncharacterized protein n=1 Tax=Adineta steineri TaxID=433720 RepID=A0A815QHL0_9BILA|nr:unnamed protein product [Adineta steineri]CAF3803681.1 unnamed protein product [Adineta steineri]